ncbi:hypothetical protein [Photobacterium rosenbergii]|uniref:hypothetical protein n=1 Tax=Photobacterium rosenbergii TaxID=294936 RepID=UPI001C998E6F|nr:hypothetical protein [Photobacterium rosenbergii]MBY5944935.1 hypothetical protein [Photobacterium rosenbergii]
MYSQEKLRIAVSLENSRLEPTNLKLTRSFTSTAQTRDKHYHGIIISSASLYEHEKLLNLSANTELFFISSAFIDYKPVDEVILNITKEILSEKMPRSIDFADIRLLNQQADILFGFDDLESTTTFLSTQDKNRIVGCIYLAHSPLSPDKYQSLCDKLKIHISDNGYFFSGFGEPSPSECTILLGMKFRE